MGQTRITRTLLAALVLLAGAGAASAQEQTKTQFAGWNVEGEVEAGPRFLIQNPNGDRTPGLADGKFEEYRDIGNGLFLENLKLRIFRPDESLSFQISGKDWGLHTQEFHLLGEHIGQWQAGFDWDQMRHIYSTDAQTLYKEFGGNVFILPPTRPTANAWNSATLWGCSASSINNTDCDGQISQQWYTGRLFFKISPTPNVDLSSELTRLYKDGQRPFGMAFGSPGGNFAELVQPISQTTYEFKLRGSWVQEIFQLQWGYTASVFVNDYPWVRADNPCVGAGNLAPPAGTTGCGAPGSSAQFGTTSLPPNNQAHTINIAGGLNLPMQTRVNSSFTYQLRLQNQDFQQQTYSNSLILTNPGLRLPQDSLNGNVQTVLYNFDVTSRPFQAPVTLNLKYRLYDYMDNSDTITFGAFIVNDQNSVTASPYRAGRYSFLRQNADLSGRYQVAKPLAMTLGVGWEGWNRSHDYEVTQSDEGIAKANFDYTPTDWLLGRATFSAGFRRGNYYNSNAWGEANGNQPPTFTGSGSQQTEMRKFNEGDRNQYIASLLFQITPVDTVAITPTTSYKNVDYVSGGLNHGGAGPADRGLLGLQTVVSWTAGMDVNWTPTKRLTFSAGYMFESIFQKQRNRNNPPDDGSMDWISDSTDQFNTYNASMKATLTEKLQFKLGATYTQSLGRVQQYSPNATGSSIYGANQPNDVTWRWPAFYDQLARLDAAMEYNFAKAWTARFFYAFESFNKSNWQTDNLTPAITPSATGSVFLGQDWRNYTAQVLGVTLRYKFE